MERIHLGTTELPMEVILEYVEALKETYSPEVQLEGTTELLKPIC